MQKTAEIPQVLFVVDVAVIMQRQVPAVLRDSWPCLQSVHRQSVNSGLAAGVMGFFAAFCCLFRTPSSWTSSPAFPWPKVVGRRGLGDAEVAGSYCEWFLPAASTMKPEEREFGVDSRASMHVVSRKDLNSADLETVRDSESPTTVLTANGEVLTKEKATVYVQELDLFVTGRLLEDTPAGSHLENYPKIMGRTTIGPVVRNHTSSKMAGRSIAIRRTTYHPLSLVYRQALQAHLHLPLQNLHRRMQ